MTQEQYEKARDEARKTNYEKRISFKAKYAEKVYKANSDLLRAQEIMREVPDYDYGFNAGADWLWHAVQPLIEAVEKVSSSEVYSNPAVMIDLADEALTEFKKRMGVSS